MTADESQSPPPFQFGLRSLFAMTAAVAGVCSLVAWLSWSWELVALLLPCTCFVAYQVFYVSISHCITRGSWDGANHATAAALAAALVAVILFFTPLFLLWIIR
jgi:hypothetical protein